MKTDTKKIILFGAATAVLYWVLDSAVSSALSHRPITESITSPSAQSLWSRIFILFCIAGFSVYFLQLRAKYTKLKNKIAEAIRKIDEQKAIINEKTTQIEAKNKLLAQEKEHRRESTELINEIRETDVDIRSVYNFKKIHDLLKIECSKSKRYNFGVGGIIVKIEDMKNMEQSLGQQTINDILNSFAMRTKTSLRISDSIGRIDVDKFLLVVNVNDKQGMQTIGQSILHLASDIALEIDTKFKISIGGGFREGGLDHDEVKKKAEDALYLATQNGGGRIQLL